MRKVYFALILSVFIHLLLAAGVNLFPLPKPPTQDLVQVEIRTTSPSQNKPHKQVVREALVPENLKLNESEDPLTFFSAQSQRVKKQTRATQLGMTENRAGTEPRKGSKTEEKKKTQPDLRGDLENNILKDAAARAAHSNSLPVLGNPGTSTIGESLPDDVQVGSFTALNTDRYLYYSFYSRVEELIRFRWESSVERALETVPKERLAANIRNRWITHMEILLNPKGEFQKVLLMKQSGISAFDQSAIRAFAEAHYFPNPPKEMVEEDGLIHLKYSFTVYYDPHLMARP